MNKTYKKVFNARRGKYVAVDETKTGHGQMGTCTVGGKKPAAITAAVVGAVLAMGTSGALASNVLETGFIEGTNDYVVSREKAYELGSGQTNLDSLTISGSGGFSNTVESANVTYTKVTYQLVFDFEQCTSTKTSWLGEGTRYLDANGVVQVAKDTESKGIGPFKVYGETVTQHEFAVKVVPVYETVTENNVNQARLNEINSGVVSATPTYTEDEEKWLKTQVYWGATSLDLKGYSVQGDLNLTDAKYIELPAVTTTVTNNENVEIGSGGLIIKADSHLVNNATMNIAGKLEISDTTVTDENGVEKVIGSSLTNHGGNSQIHANSGVVIQAQSTLTNEGIFSTADITGSGTVINSGTFTANNITAGSVTNSGSVATGEAFDFNVSGQISGGSVTNDAGRFHAGSIANATSVTNKGTLFDVGSVAADFVKNESGQFNATTITAGSVSNSGTLSVGGSVTADSIVNDADKLEAGSIAAGTLSVAGGIVTSTGNVTVDTNATKDGEVVAIVGQGAELNVTTNEQGVKGNLELGNKHSSSEFVNEGDIGVDGTVSLKGQSYVVGIEGLGGYGVNNTTKLTNAGTINAGALDIYHQVTGLSNTTDGFASSSFVNEANTDQSKPNATFGTVTATGAIVVNKGWMDAGETILKDQDGLASVGSTLTNEGQYDTGSLTVGSLSTVTNAGTLNVTSNSGLVNNGTVYNNAGTVDVTGTFENKGTLNNNAVVDGDKTTTGTIEVGKLVNSGSINNNAGQLIVNNGMTNSGTLTNDATINITGDLVNNAAQTDGTGKGTIINNKKATINVTGSFTNYGDLINAGLIDVSGALTSEGSIENSGDIIAGEGFTSTGSLINSGVIESGGDITISGYYENIGGTLKQEGSLIVDDEHFTVGGDETISGDHIVDKQIHLTDSKLTVKGNASAMSINAINTQLSIAGNTTLTGKLIVDGGKADLQGQLTAGGIFNKAADGLTLGSLDKKDQLNHSITNNVENQAQLTVYGDLLAKGFKNNGGHFNIHGDVTVDNFENLQSEARVTQLTGGVIDGNLSIGVSGTNTSNTTVTGTIDMTGATVNNGGMLDAGTLVVQNKANDGISLSGGTGGADGSFVNQAGGHLEAGKLVIKDQIPVNLVGGNYTASFENQAGSTSIVGSVEMTGADSLLSNSGDFTTGSISMGSFDFSSVDSVDDLTSLLGQNGAISNDGTLTVGSIDDNGEAIANGSVTMVNGSLTNGANNADAEFKAGSMTSIISSIANKGEMTIEGTVNMIGGELKNENSFTAGSLVVTGLNDGKLGDLNLGSVGEIGAIADMLDAKVTNTGSVNANQVTLIGGTLENKEDSDKVGSIVAGSLLNVGGTVKNEGSLTMSGNSDLGETLGTVVNGVLGSVLEGELKDYVSGILGDTDGSGITGALESAGIQAGYIQTAGSLNNTGTFDAAGVSAVVGGKVTNTGTMGFNDIVVGGVTIKNEAGSLTADKALLALGTLENSADFEVNTMVAVGSTITNSGDMTIAGSGDATNVIKDMILDGVEGTDFAKSDAGKAILGALGSVENLVDDKLSVGYAQVGGELNNSGNFTATTGFSGLVGIGESDALEGSITNTCSMTFNDFASLNGTITNTSADGKNGQFKADEMIMIGGELINKAGSVEVQALVNGAGTVTNDAELNVTGSTVLTNTALDAIPENVKNNKYASAALDLVKQSTPAMGYVQVGGLLDNNESGTLTAGGLSGVVQGQVDNDGTLKFNDFAAYGADIDNGGMFDADKMALIGGTFDNEGKGIVDVNTMVTISGNVTNKGNMTVNGSGDVTNVVKDLVVGNLNSEWVESAQGKAILGVLDKVEDQVELKVGYAQVGGTFTNEGTFDATTGLSGLVGFTTGEGEAAQHEGSIVNNAGSMTFNDFVAVNGSITNGAQFTADEMVTIGGSITNNAGEFEVESLVAAGTTITNKAGAEMTVTGSDAVTNKLVDIIPDSIKTHQVGEVAMGILSDVNPQAGFVQVGGALDNEGKFVADAGVSGSIEGAITNSGTATFNDFVGYKADITNDVNGTLTADKVVLAGGKLTNNAAPEVQSATNPTVDGKVTIDTLVTLSSTVNNAGDMTITGSDNLTAVAADLVMGNLGDKFLESTTGKAVAGLVDTLEAQAGLNVGYVQAGGSLTNTGNFSATTGLSGLVGYGEGESFEGAITNKGEMAFNDIASVMGSIKNEEGKFTADEMIMVGGELANNATFEAEALINVMGNVTNTADMTIAGSEALEGVMSQFLSEEFKGSTAGQFVTKLMDDMDTSAGYVQVGGTMTNIAGADLTVNGTASGVISGTLDNVGTATFKEFVGVDATINNAGSLTAKDVLLVGGTFANSATDAELSKVPTVTVDTMVAAGATVTNNGSFTVTGTNVSDELVDALGAYLPKNEDGSDTTLTKAVNAALMATGVELGLVGVHGATIENNGTMNVTGVSGLVGSTLNNNASLTLNDQLISLGSDITNTGKVDAQWVLAAGGSIVNGQAETDAETSGTLDADIVGLWDTKFENKTNANATIDAMLTVNSNVTNDGTLTTVAGVGLGADLKNKIKELGDAVGINVNDYLDLEKHAEVGYGQIGGTMVNNGKWDASNVLTAAGSITNTNDMNVAQNLVMVDTDFTQEGKGASTTVDGHFTMIDVNPETDMTDLYIGEGSKFEVKGATVLAGVKMENHGHLVTGDGQIDGAGNLVSELHNHGTWESTNLLMAGGSLLNDTDAKLTVSGLMTVGSIINLEEGEKISNATVVNNGTLDTTGGVKTKIGDREIDLGYIQVAGSMTNNGSWTTDHTWIAAGSVTNNDFMKVNGQLFNAGADIVNNKTLLNTAGVHVGSVSADVGYVQLGGTMVNNGQWSVSDIAAAAGSIKNSETGILTAGNVGLADTDFTNAGLAKVDGHFVMGDVNGSMTKFENSGKAEDFKGMSVTGGMMLAKVDFTNTGDMTVGNGTYDGMLTIESTLDNDGTLKTTNLAVMGGSLTNDGTLSATGPVVVGGTIKVGEENVKYDATKVVNNGTMSTLGIIENELGDGQHGISYTQLGGSMTNNGTWKSHSVGMVDTDFANNGLATIKGHFAMGDVNGSTTKFVNSGKFADKEGMTVTGGMLLANVNLNNTGDLTVGNGTYDGLVGLNCTVANAGTLSTTNMLLVGGSLTNGGTLEATGPVVITGTLKQEGQDDIVYAAPTVTNDGTMTTLGIIVNELGDGEHGISYTQLGGSMTNNGTWMAHSVGMVDTDFANNGLATIKGHFAMGDVNGSTTKFVNSGKFADKEGMTVTGGMMLAKVDFTNTGDMTVGNGKYDGIVAIDSKLANSGTLTTTNMFIVGNGLTNDGTLTANGPVVVTGTLKQDGQDDIVYAAPTVTNDGTMNLYGIVENELGDGQHGISYTQLGGSLTNNGIWNSYSVGLADTNFTNTDTATVKGHFVMGDVNGGKTTFLNDTNAGMKVNGLMTLAKVDFTNKGDLTTGNGNIDGFAAVMSNVTNAGTWNTTNMTLIGSSLTNDADKTLTVSGLMTVGGVYGEDKTMLGGDVTNNGMLTTTGKIGVNFGTAEAPRFVDLGYLQLAGSMTNNGDWTTDHTMIAGGSVANNKTMTVKGQLNNLGGDIANDGTLTTKGGIEVDGKTWNAGYVQTAGSMTNTGTWDASEIYAAAGSIKNLGNGVMNTQSMTLLDTDFTNANTVKVDGDFYMTEVESSGERTSLNNMGSMTITGSMGLVGVDMTSKNLDVTGDFAFTSLKTEDGTLVANSQATNVGTMTVGGTAYIGEDATFNNAADMTANALGVSGTFEQTSGTLTTNSQAYVEGKVNLTGGEWKVNGSSDKVALYNDGSITGEGSLTINDKAIAVNTTGSEFAVGSLNIGAGATLMHGIDLDSTFTAEDGKDYAFAGLITDKKSQLMIGKTLNVKNLNVGDISGTGANFGSDSMTIVDVSGFTAASGNFALVSGSATKLDIDSTASLVLSGVGHGGQYNIAHGFDLTNSTIDGWTQDNGTLYAIETSGTGLNWILEKEFVNSDLLINASLESVADSKLYNANGWNVILANIVDDSLRMALAANTQEASTMSLRAAPVAAQEAFDTRTMIAELFMNHNVDAMTKVVVSNSLASVAQNIGVESLALENVTDTMKGIENHASMTNASVKGSNLWANVLGGEHKQDGLKSSGGASLGYDADDRGFMIGYDIGADAMNARFGFALSYVDGNVNSVGNHLATTGDYNTFGIHGYMNWTPVENVNVIATVGYSRNSAEAEMNLPKLSGWDKYGKATADVDTNIFSAGVRAEKSFTYENVSIVPHAGLRLMAIDVGSYDTKIDGNTAFHNDADTAVIGQLPIGVTVKGEFEKNGWNVKPMADLTFVPQFGDTESQTTVTFPGGTVSDKHVAEFTGDFATSMTLGVEAQKGDYSIGMQLGVTKGQDKTDSSFMAKVRYQF